MPTLTDEALYDIEADHADALQEDADRTPPEPVFVVVSFTPDQAQAVHELLTEARIPSPIGKVLIGQAHEALIQAAAENVVQ